MTEDPVPQDAAAPAPPAPPVEPEHPIFAVIRLRQIEAVKKIVDADASVLFMHDSKGWSPVHEAVESGGDTIYRYLRDKLREARQKQNSPANTDAKKPVLKHTNSMLEVACGDGDIERVKKLLQDHHQAKVPMPKRVLIRACASGNLELVKLLAERSDVQINFRDNGETALLAAIKHKHNAIVDYLVNEKQCSVAGPYLLQAIWANNSHAVDTLLTRKDLDPNKVGEHRFQGTSIALHEAIARGDDTLIDKILAHPNAQLNAKNYGGSTAMHVAVEHQHPDMVKKLLALEAFLPDVADRQGITSFLNAVQQSGPHAVEIAGLLAADKRVNVQTVDADKNNALHLAMQRPFVPLDMLSFLLKQPIARNAVNAKGRSVAVLSTFPIERHAFGKKDEGDFLGLGTAASLNQLALLAQHGMLPFPEANKMPQNYAIFKYMALTEAGFLPKNTFEVDEQFGQLVGQLIKAGAIESQEIPSGKTNTLEAVQRFADFATVVGGTYHFAKCSLGQFPGVREENEWFTHKEVPREVVDALAANLLKNTDHNWAESGRNIAQMLTRTQASAEDTVREFIRYALVPEIVRQAGGGNDLSCIDTGRLINALLKPTLNVLAEDRDAATLMGLDERWHARRAGMLGEMMDPQVPSSNDRWYAILPGRRADVPEAVSDKHLHIVNLTSEAELRAEGGGVEKGGLEHCVGGYAHQCTGMGWRSTISHIFSIRSGSGADEKRLSTVEVTLSHDNTPYVRQHQGLRNTTPPKEAEAALEWFLKEVKEKRITLNTSKQGAVAKDKHEGIPTVITDIGMIPDTLQKTNERFAHFKGSELRPLARDEHGNPVRDDEESAKRNVDIYRQQRHTYLLPNAYRNMDVQTFLDKTGLGKIAMNELKKQQVVMYNDTPEPLTPRDTHLTRVLVGRYYQQARREAGEIQALP